MLEGNLDEGTKEFLTSHLKQLNDQANQWTEQLQKDTDEQQKWRKVQERLDKFHKRCLEIRENLDDPNYEPDYEEKRDILEFFGITVVVWPKNNEVRFQIWCNPPDVVSLISKIVDFAPDRRVVQSSRPGRRSHRSRSQPQRASASGSL